MTEETTIKPSNAMTVSEVLETMIKDFKNIGLSFDDFITLVHKRTKGKVNKTDVRTTVKAIREMYKDMERKK